jgi:hypothetical protein
MSYEVFIDVFIDVVHHPKYADDPERKESSCFQWADLPEGTDELVYVVNALRSMAEEIDPRVVCGHCGVTRGEHYQDAGGRHRCFNRMGPITQNAWWGPAVTDSGYPDAGTEQGGEQSGS